MPQSEEEKKRLIKEAIKEWLDEKFAAFGKWTILGLSSALFIGFIKMVFAGWWLGLTRH